MARLLPLASLLGIVLLSVGCHPGAALPPGVGELFVGSQMGPDPWGADSSNAQEDPSETDFFNGLETDSSDSLDDNDIIEDETDEVLEGDDDDDDDDLDDLPDFADDDEPIDDGVIMPVQKLTDQELVFYLNLEDRILIAEMDEYVAGKLVEERLSLSSQGQRVRRKRVAPLIGRAAWMIGRAMFRRFSRAGITRSGRRITRHYNGRGSYRDAARDFDRMRLDNVRPIRSGNISGRTGTLGPNRHRVTVRDGSSARSGNRPTLEIHSHNGRLVRKMRYDD